MSKVHRNKAKSGSFPRFFWPESIFPTYKYQITKEKIMKTRSVVLLMALIVMLLVTTQCTSSPAPTSAPANPASTSAVTSPSALDGKALFEQRCGTCHGLDRVQNEGGNADQWKRVVDNMIQRGAKLNSDEAAAVVNYLAQTYP
jgi:hypothetical protein